MKFRIALAVAAAPTMGASLVYAQDGHMMIGAAGMAAGWAATAKDEAETRDALQKSASVRKTGATGKEADRHFFETLVRVHRAGEGAAYTGLKPAGEIEPAGAYVEYVHYVEGLYNAAGPAKSEHAGHAATAAAKPTGHQH